MTRLNILHRVLLGALTLSTCGCIYVQQAGTYLGRAVGIVPGKTEYGLEEQRAQATAIISPEQEYYIGRAVAARMLARFKADSDEQHQHFLQLVGAALISSGAASDTFGGYHFIIIQSDQLNAISAPGGYVFVTTGFLKVLTDEDQLAGILAHEIAHVEKRHGIKMLQRSDEFAALASLGLAAGSLNCAEALTQATALFTQLVDNLIDTLLEKGYSKDMEFEADGRAAELMGATGYQPASLLEALALLDQAHVEHSSGGWFSTHPSVADRLEKLGTNGIIPGNPEDSAYQTRRQRFTKAMVSSY